jgi:hypothetical protein
MEVADKLAEALAMWSQFPVHAAERPVVPIGELLREAGYVSSEAKMAFAEKRLRVDAGVAADAVAALVAELGPLAPETDQSLAVRSAVPVRHAFSTDRGPQELRAWSLEVTDSLGPVVVLDVVERRRLWWPPERRGGAGTAHCLDADCTRLHYRFFGTPAAYADYDGVDLAASETAVAVLPREHYTVAEGAVMLAYAQEREVDVRLAEPLGARVLISGTGYAIVVLQAGATSGGQALG